MIWDVRFRAHPKLPGTSGTGWFAAIPLFDNQVQMQPFQTMTNRGSRDDDVREPRVGRHLSLRDYVRRRTGVPLGHRDSMRNMLDRSLGAADFSGFWRHWNPIWSYGLARYIMAPLNRTISFPAALVATFAASGLIHDLVIMAIRRELTLLFTPWFVLCAILVVLGNRFGWRVTEKPWAARAALNLFQLAATGGLAMFTMDKFGLR